MKNFYISTSIPYVNGEPHIGHSLEFIQADVVARYNRLLGKDVFFVSGTDENSLKNVQSANKDGKDVKDFVDEYSQKFQDLVKDLDISVDDFIRTTEDRHFKGAQKLWETLNKDDIYKKKYKGLYCVGCEAFYNEDELEDGKCPEHKKEPEVIEEENYFFKLSKYADKIKELLNSKELQIIPENRKNEALSFIEKGLEDFSISRSIERAHGWGVPVPNDKSQIMYVWVDALSNYINALGFAEDSQKYKDFWIQEGQDREVLHTLGKGISRFHVLYWIGLLLSAKIPLPTQEFIHGYITINGEKISKSLGNVIAPKELVERYGADATRFYLLGAVSSFQDGDFSFDKCDEYYTAHLVNGIGNLTSRVLTMAEKYTKNLVPAVKYDVFDTENFWVDYKKAIENFDFQRAVKQINSLTAKVDGYISEQKPWEKAKAGEDVSGTVYQLLEVLRHLAVALLPIIPSTAKQILVQLDIEKEDLNFEQETAWGLLKPQSEIKKGKILFPRLERLAD
ncbi:MAG: methionine--tRNA ligase [Candidatus Magasanikbacteria bacterium]|nr:methionine--tRNA ligase [Candidatus Magasanikbacteria bacterium]